VSALSTVILVVWVLFWVGWLASAATAKAGTRARVRVRSPGLIAVILVVVLTRIFRGGSSVHEVALRVVGAALFAAGLGLAVWARVHLGRNWGMPMSQKDEPELVTSGPYSRVRHPIYSGILLAMLGTALSAELYWLIVMAVLGFYFLYAASVEERDMAATFPSAYPPYRARTKMLIPFVL
jgi:protein-S-isoprenylcysteine O-methyltransferase Ste14